MTFSDLKSKDVPSSGGLLNLIKQDREGCLIPWKCVLRIGDDVILVDVREDSGNIAVENST